MIDNAPITDPFFYEQPPMDFIEELKSPVHAKRDTGFVIREAAAKEICIRGLFIKERFPHSEELLLTAYEDIHDFSVAYEISGEEFPIYIRYAEGYSFEKHKIELLPDGFYIYASDTEGVRRALVYIEDRIKAAECCCLEPFSLTRKPFVKTRITRCFFGPINRAPKHIDELFDELDYYPENYLQRLAHDGSNGLWIYVNFRDLLPSPVVGEFGENSEKRFEKLRRVVEKCLRYGIKIYLLGCEPMGLPEELIEKYSDMLGVYGWGGKTICPRTEKGRAHIVGMVKKLFTSVPRLGGLISITAGELATTCASTDAWCDCPRCSRYSRGESVAYTAKLIEEGIREAGAEGEFISFSYGHRYWNFNDIVDYVEHAPKRTALMQNFEDFGFVEQLGKTRLSLDYWLSYPGPSYLYKHTAAATKRYGKKLYAKMQICNSHEIASVPCIPAPGLLFDKYRAAREMGVEGILQCWYFGNYPSLMSRAAGELSFREDFSDKHEFLRELAAKVYGKSHAEDIARALECFERGYRNYPVNAMFNYYGPMHDGVCHELSLIPKNRPMPRTWMSMDKCDGDRIYECLNAAHTLDEALTLSEMMCEGWSEGMKILDRLGDIPELSSLSGALMAMLSSGRNILKFYKLREKLGFIGYGKCDESATGILEKMRKVVLDEIENSEKISALCKVNTKLGYHSEAEGFKYFPKKCAHRIKCLQKMLEDEFPIVEKRVREGKAPLGYYLAEGVEDAYILTDSEETACFEAVGSGGFKLSRSDDTLDLHIRCDTSDEVVFSFEFMLMATSAVMRIKDGRLSMNDTQDAYLCGYYGENYDREMKRYRMTRVADGYRISIPRESYEITPEAPIKLKIRINSDEWKIEDVPTVTLGKGECSPGMFGWIVPKN